MPCFLRFFALKLICRTASSFIFAQINTFKWRITMEQFIFCFLRIDPRVAPLRTCNPHRYQNIYLVLLRKGMIFSFQSSERVMFALPQHLKFNHDIPRRYVSHKIFWCERHFPAFHCIIRRESC